MLNTVSGEYLKGRNSAPSLQNRAEGDEWRECAINGDASIQQLVACLTNLNHERRRRSSKVRKKWRNVGGVSDSGFVDGVNGFESAVSVAESDISKLFRDRR